MDVIANSQVKDNEVIIPDIIMKKYNITDNTVIDWMVNDDNEAVLLFRKKRDIKDLKGLIVLDEVTDSVELKKEVYK